MEILIRGCATIRVVNIVVLVLLPVPAILFSTFLAIFDTNTFVVRCTS